jgi:hypothetical protein
MSASINSNVAVYISAMSYSALTWRAPGRWSCYARRMKLNLPKATAVGHRQVATVLWRKASSLPKDKRLKALRHAELHAHLARALDADPDRLIQEAGIEE